MKKRDLTNRTFGSLTALYPDEPRRGKTQQKTRWRVRCRCGKEFSCDTGDLVREDGRGRVSCGCLNHATGPSSPHWRGGTLTSGTYLGALRRGAAVRGYEFAVTVEDLDLVFLRQGERCALTGVPLVMGDNASVDRVDSSRGYTPENIQWVDKTINQMKSDLDQGGFLDWCRKVADNERP